MMVVNRIARMGVLRRMLACLIAGMGWVAAAPVLAPGVLENLKAATAYVEVSVTHHTGSAFCISPEGYFVTCAHVLNGRAEGDKVTLTLNSGLREEKKLEAAIVRKDEDHDVAVLKSQPLGIVPLQLGSADGMKETDPVTAAGFPFGEKLSLGGKAPAVSVTPGSITALRRGDGKVDVVQIDAELNPGNSGGPVIDTQGKVIGVAAAKVEGTKMNFAVSTRWVSALLVLPRIEATSPTIAAERVSSPLEIPFTLSYIKPPAVGPKVSAWFEGGGKSTQADVTTSGGGRYVLKGIPSRDLESLSSSLLRVDFVKNIGNSRLTQTVKMADATIKVGGTALKLSSLSAVYVSEKRVVIVGGKEIRGEIEGMGLLKDTQGNDLSVLSENYPMLSIRPEGSSSLSLECRIEVVIGNHLQTLRIPLRVESGSSNSPALGSVRNPSFVYPPAATPAFEDDFVDIKLEGPAEKVVWGGGGRYAVLKLAGKSSLVVIDCLEGLVHGEMPLPSNEASFTAGAEQVVAASGSEMTVWSLRDPTAPPLKTKAVDGTILSVASGSAWSGQMAMVWELPAYGKGSSGAPRLDLRDILTGRIQAIEKNLTGNGWSATGDSFEGAAMARRFSGGGRVFELVEGQLAGRTGSGRLDAGGRWLLSPNGTYRSVTKEGETHGEYLRGPLIPSTVPGLVLRLWQGSSDSRDATEGGQRVDILDLDVGECLLRRALVLDELSAPKERQLIGDAQKDKLGQNCNLVPQLGFFASLSWDRSIVRIRKFDLWSALREAKQPFLKVAGAVPDVVAAGGAFSCDLGVKASSGKVRGELLKAPSGVVLNADGILQWPLPKVGQGGPVLIRFTGDDGTELLWRQDLWVR